jgi:hypothetical protein
MRTIVIVAVLATSADAGPLTIGADIGLTHSDVDGNDDATPTLGVFARLALGMHVAGELELARIGMIPGLDAAGHDGMTSVSGVDMKQAGALVVVDLGDGSLVPVVLVGAGVDHAMWGAIVDTVYAHAEAGLGLEWRTSAGFTLGADLRIGDRSIVSQSTADVLLNVWPRLLSEGEYRSGRLFVGARF